MIILHFASIANKASQGVDVVVPQYLKYQKKENIVGLININNERVMENDYVEGSTRGFKQLTYNQKFDINMLEPPFNKPDIVLFQECYVLSYIKISKNLRENSIPYVIIPHGELQKEAQRKSFIKKKIANSTIFRNFIKKAIAIQCLSEGEKEATYFGVNKIVVENGVDIPEIIKTSYSENQIVFSYIGRMAIKHKGIDLMIKAASIVRDELRSKNACIYLYGTDMKGSKYKIQKDILKYKIEDIVKVKNPVYGEEKLKVLLNTDVFIQTSRFEGMPMGVLEALSYGIPCLLTKGTNLSNYVKKGNAGWCAENNETSIAEAIQLAISERKLYNQKGYNAKKIIENNFSWVYITSKMIDAYKALLNG